MIFTTFDLWPLWVIYLAIIILLFVSAEIGFYIGKLRLSKVADASNEGKQTGSIMGASLGLLAFLLAFSFNFATNIHSERKGLILEEANAIGTLYLRADLFDLKQANQMKAVLSEYIQIRLDTVKEVSNEGLDKKIKESEKKLDQLWKLLKDIMIESETKTGIAQLINSTNAVIDIHSKRLGAGQKRLPLVSIFILIFIAMLTLALMGYQSGLNGARVLIPRTALILSFATVMILVADLDRPGSDLINISQKAMLDLKEQILNSAK